MNSGITRPADAGPDTSALTAAAGGSRRWWWPWLVAVALAAVTGGAVGAVAEHAVDQGQASRDQYRAQVRTTIWRVLGAEGQLIAEPAAKRDASGLDDLADSISSDPGVDGSGTLTVRMGAGSAAQPDQVIFTVTVSSPYGATAFAVWYLTPQGRASSEEGACVLSSTLLGTGRATRDLQFGGGLFEPPCPSKYWSASADPGQPRFDLAGISHQPPL
jgi:hypothetical protein